MSAKSWLIADTNGNIVEQQNIHNIQPIASITKLMTVMVVLDAGENLNNSYVMKKFKTPVTRKEMIDLAIIHSDNQAADMLCKLYIRGYHGCIEDMNKKAEELGMNNTIFYDSTGLDNRNVSNANDLLKLLQSAEKYNLITHASTKSSVSVIVPTKKKNKYYKWSFSNTNPLVSKYDMIVSKTGYVRASGGCMAVVATINGEKKYFVVLNSKTTKTRVHDMETLFWLRT